ncbi:hypothetical protein SeMB42_g01326 [Synchytrium endobioticum]|uniref:Flavin-containing monooxygenase n=1 Tax=Synchytrium endobioticum TaxID=286115 RepID=A0A507DC15_9FUNG|nr:hypothetical protein SeLEV6574_g01606 [Synchytrium endobioticum]TPX52582.1 hypothetical protein SeMB42_g01326 [Synchytrium endobioticum]
MKKPIRKVAVIGAGVAGLVALKHLKDDFECTAFEQFDYIGGIWHYTDPSARPDTSAPSLRDTPGQPTSPIYANMVTNLPPDLMSIRGYEWSHAETFPHHIHVLQYIHSFAQHYGVHAHIVLNTVVTDVRYDEQRDAWIVKRTGKGAEHVEAFDAIVVANGHYNVPCIGDVPTDAFTGRVVHSRDYNHPNEYEGHVVVVVGAGPSGLDIATELSKHTCTYLSVRDPTAVSTLIGTCRVKVVPYVTTIMNRTVTFADGTSIDVDVVLLATGYLYSYPFLDGLEDLVTDGRSVRGLYKYLFYIKKPTLVFLGLPMKIEPFTIIDYQCQAIKRVFTGEASLPSEEDMITYEVESARRRGVDLGSRQYMVFNPLRAQVDYHMSLVEEFGGPDVENPEGRIDRREMVLELKRVHSQKLY